MDSTHVVEISKKEIVIQELKDQIKAMDARAKRGNLEKEKMISISEDEKNQIIIQKKKKMMKMPQRKMNKFTTYEKNSKI